MVYFVVVFSVLILLHFIYESIVAPPLRRVAELKLIALRERLAKLERDGEVRQDYRRIESLRDSLTVLIRTVDKFAFSTVIRARHRMDRDPRFRARVEERSRTLDECGSPQLIEIREQSMRIALHLLTINCAGGLLYVAPLLWVWNGYAYMKTAVRTLASVPPLELNRIGRRV